MATFGSRKNTYATPYEDIRDYGAISGGGNASTNVTAFNNALAAIPNGGTILVPKGVWAVNDTITINNDHVWIVGEVPLQRSIFSGSLGKGSTILWSAGTAVGKPIIDFCPAAGTAPDTITGGGLKDLNIDGNGNGNPNGPDFGVRLRAAFQQHFYDCHISECNVACWEMTDFNQSAGWTTSNNCWGTQFHRCSAFTFSRPGTCFRASTNTTISTYSGATHVDFFGCLATVNNGICVEFDTCDDMYWWGGVLNVSNPEPTGAYDPAYGRAIVLHGRDLSGGHNFQKAATDSAFHDFYTSGFIHVQAGTVGQPATGINFSGINYTHDVDVEELIDCEDGTVVSWWTNRGFTRGFQREHRDCAMPIEEDFMGGWIGVGSTGTYGWNNSGAAHFTQKASEQGHPGIMNMTTGATGGTVEYLCLGVNGTGIMYADDHFDMWSVVRLNTNDVDTQVRIGLLAAGSSDGPPNGVYVEKALDDQNWKLVTQFGTRTVSASQAATSTNWITFRMQRMTTYCKLYVNASDNTIFQSGNFPTGISLQPTIQIKNRTGVNAAKDIDIDLVKLYVTGLNRS